MGCAALLTANGEEKQNVVVSNTYTYEASGESILNPERGFFDWVELLDENGQPNTEYGYVRENQATLAFAYIRLQDFLDSPISDARIEALDTALSAARGHGVKLIIRIAYNVPGERGLGRDASLDRITQHTQQLRTLFENNSDIIAFVQAGIIGQWGEWHSSSPELETSSARAKVLDALINAAPSNIFVQLRRPSHMIELFPKRLSERSAFSGRGQARIGHHNDCFLSSHDDVGTYHPIARKDEFQSYIKHLSKYAPIGGETCSGIVGQRRTSCHHTHAELKEFGWTYLNRNYLESDITRWKQEGCFKTISDALGYRYRLVESEFPSQARLGRRLRFSLTIANDGYAKLYNPRDVQLVFVGNNGEEAARVDLAASDSKAVWFFSNQDKAVETDLRKWLPEAGTYKQRIFTPSIPHNLAPGAYRLMLAFPDPSPALNNKPDFSIRLANSNMWREHTGLNDLGVNITLVQ